MALTDIKDRFGKNAQVLTTTTSVTASPTNPALVLSAADFTPWNTPSGGAELDPEKWQTALILAWYAFSQATGNKDNQAFNVQVGLAFITIQERQVEPPPAAAVRKRHFSFQVDVFEPDTGEGLPDPDNV